jgi:hypothetical protein
MNILYHHGYHFVVLSWDRGATKEGVISRSLAMCLCILNVVSSDSKSFAIMVSLIAM